MVTSPVAPAGEHGDDNTLSLDSQSPLEPPSRPYTSAGVNSAGDSSARTSFTRIDDEEAGSQGQAAHPTSHEPMTTTAPSTEGAALNTEEAIDPSKHELEHMQPDVTAPSQTSEAPVPHTPQTYITFLLISGKRKTMSFEPETAVGRVKELVWNAWPAGTKPLLYLFQRLPLGNRVAR